MDVPTFSQEKLLEVFNSLSDEEKKEFLKDITELLELQTAYVAKAKTIAEG